MIVRVCPAEVTQAPPDRLWTVLTAPERFGEWTDAKFVEAKPAGPVQPGQIIHLTAPSLGRTWPVTITVRDIDPGRRWIDLVVRLPFGVENHEHLTLTETPTKGTLVRLN